MYRTSLQLQIDDYINKYKATRWKKALGCFDYFFHLILIIITKHFNMNISSRPTEETIADLEGTDFLALIR